MVSLPGGIHTRIGPPSSVVLKTTYLDERVRLGKGSRGSLFVFTRGGESERAGMELVGRQRTTPLGTALVAGECSRSPSPRNPKPERPALQTTLNPASPSTQAAPQPKHTRPKQPISPDAWRCAVTPARLALEFKV